MDDRKQREKEYHDIAFSEHTRTSASKYYMLFQKVSDFYKNRLLTIGKGKRVLEYGCGADSHALILAQNGATMTGIDISPVAVDVSQKDAHGRGIDNVEFLEMDAEKLEFEEGTFDLICGSGILHHLKLDTAYSEIMRTLKKNGKAVFIEPLGHNPAINIYRKLTPKMRTEDEHPLLSQDLEFTRSRFNKVNITYFNLFTFASLLFLKTPLFSLVYKVLSAFDKLVFVLLPFARKYAWIAVIEVEK